MNKTEIFTLIKKVDFKPKLIKREKVILIKQFNNKKIYKSKLDTKFHSKYQVLI